MRVLKIATKDGSVYFMGLLGFPDAQQVELMDMSEREYHEIPATMDSYERFKQSETPAKMPPSA